MAGNLPGEPNTLSASVASACKIASRTCSGSISGLPAFEASSRARKITFRAIAVYRSYMRRPPVLRFQRARFPFDGLLPPSAGNEEILPPQLALLHHA